MIDPQPIDTTGLQEKHEEWLAFIAATHHGAHHRTNRVAPFTPLSRPVSQSRVALLTTAGAHLDDQEPFHVETVAGDHTFRLLPDDLDPGRLRFSHTHYVTSSARQDPNVVFPLARLHELVERGRVGSAAPFHVGMMGFNPDPTGVADELAPAVAAMLIETEVDLAILVPG